MTARWRCISCLMLLCMSCWKEQNKTEMKYVLLLTYYALAIIGRTLVLLKDPLIGLRILCLSLYLLKNEFLIWELCLSLAVIPPILCRLELKYWLFSNMYKRHSPATAWMCTPALTSATWLPRLSSLCWITFRNGRNTGSCCYAPNHWVPDTLPVVSQPKFIIAKALYSLFCGLFAESKAAEDESYQSIDSFLSKVPQDILAYASYNCGAYTRSLRHWEQHMKESQESQGSPDGQCLDFLQVSHLTLISEVIKLIPCSFIPLNVQRLYVALEEVDGVTGVMTLRVTPPTLDEQILAYESLGQLSDASMCYDQAIQLRPDDLNLRQGLLKCRLALGELQSAMDLCNGMIAAE